MDASAAAATGTVVDIVRKWEAERRTPAMVFVRMGADIVETVVMIEWQNIEVQRQSSRKIKKASGVLKD